MIDAMTGRQQALLELLKVTHHPSRSADTNLEDALFYLKAIVAEAEPAKPAKDAKK